MGEDKTYLQKEISPDGPFDHREHALSSRPGEGSDSMLPFLEDLALSADGISGGVASPPPSSAGPTCASTLETITPGDFVHDRYKHMPAVTRARDIFLGVVARTCRDRFVEGAVEKFLDVSLGCYINTDQYHNAEHAFLVSAYSLALLKKAGLLNDGRSVMRASLRGLFHDSGNALHPEIRPELKGQDEVDAALLLLRETNLPTHRLRLPPDKVSLVERQGGNRFDGQERLFDSACILGTVFPDRFCSESALGKQEYVKRYCDQIRQNARDWSIGDSDVQQLAASLGMKGCFSLSEELERVVTRCMVSKEAYALRHADLCASSTLLEGLKAHLTNRDEDKVKKNVAGETEPANYSRGFYHFVAGMSHPFLHPEDLSSTAFLKALQWRFNDLVTFGCIQEACSGRAERLKEKLVTAGLDPLQAASLADYTRQQGWKPEIFYGLGSDEVNRFGEAKLKKIDQFAEWLKSPDAQVVKFLHLALVEDQKFDLSAKSIGEIYERARDVAARKKIPVNWSDYPLLSSPESPWRNMSLASLSGMIVWQIIAPCAASGINLNELQEELGLQV